MPPSVERVLAVINEKPGNESKKYQKSFNFTLNELNLSAFVFFVVKIDGHLLK
jgi:hypothetical protein